VTSTGSGTLYFFGPATSTPSGKWTTMTGTFTINWTGTLTQAGVGIITSVINPYYMDEASLTDITYPTGSYVIDRQLLSPSVNPYGSQQTNGQGIYVINCASKNVVVGRARIAGTLVFLNPGNNSLIQGPVIWEPAVYNYPSVLTDSALEVGFNSSLGLDEAALNINLNPPGTPYPFQGGTANPTLTDTYPSKINGLLYSTNDWNFSGTPAISGVIVADHNVKITATSLTLNYLNTFLTTPPPGFDLGATSLKIVPGYWKRAVN
jgi:hypothetical protein